jgi:hypothetical protein
MDGKTAMGRNDELEETVLILRCRVGDREAPAELIDRYYRRLRYFIVRLAAGDPSDPGQRRTPTRRAAPRSRRKPDRARGGLLGLGDQAWTGALAIARGL